MHRSTKSFQTVILIAVLAACSMAVFAAPPTADSVTPNAGSGASQAFTFKFSSDTGFANLNALYIIMNTGLSAAAGCVPYYVPASNSIYLFNDAGSGATGPITPGSGLTLSNSQCTISGSGASASGAGDTLTLTLPITFKPAFKGQQTIFGYAADSANQNSGWQTLGTWTPNPGGAPSAPTADSVTPNSGTGSAQSFTFKYSSSGGFGNIAGVYALINSTLSAAAGCVVYYAPAANALYLFNDAGNGASGPLTAGTAGTLSNSQCTVNGSGSSASGNGNTLAVAYSLTFAPGFKGAQTLYGYAADNGGLNSGFQNLGTWTPSGSGQPSAPTADSVTPNTGSGASQNFTFKYSSTGGFANLSALYALFNSSLSATAGCVPVYLAATNSLYLYNDAGNAVLGPLTPGAAGTLANSQCSINLATSSASGSGNTLSLNLAVTFTSAFKGPQTIYGYAADKANMNSGWQTLGTWTASGGGGQPSAPTADSVTPNASTGGIQNFAFKFSSPNGYQYLNIVYGEFNSTQSAVNGCVPVYIVSGNSLYLYNDAGNAVLGPITPGAAGTLSNSQCSINGSGSSVSGSGNTLTLNLATTFTGTFKGKQTIFGYAADSGGMNSGWQSLGSWTPAVIQAVAPTADSVTPDSGAGSAQNFTFKFSSVNGFQYLNVLYALINQSLNVTNGCVAYYVAGANALYLYDDTGANVLGPITPGVAGTLSNTQCTINGAATTVSGAGNTLSLNLAVSFAASLKAKQTLFGFAIDNANMNSGWQMLGTWTPSTPALTLSPAQLTIPSGGNQNFTLTIPGALQTPLNVTLVSDNTAAATVQSVTIPANTTSISVPVHGVAPGSAGITATAAGYSSAAALAKVVDLSVSIAAVSVGLGNQANLLVTLSAAPQSNVTVNLTSSDTSKATVPASVVIPAGATTPATAPLVTGAGIGTANITGAATGYKSGSGTVTITAPTMTFSAASVPVNVGQTATVTLNLANGQAPPGGLTVNLSSNDTAKATVPASVLIPAGQQTANVTITGVAGGSATITASASGITSATTTANVVQQTVSVGSTSVALGQQSLLQVTLSAPATAPVTVTLISSDSSKVTISPASVTIPVNATMPSVAPQVTGVALGSATISASAPGYISGGNGTVGVFALAMAFSGSPLSVNVGGTNTLTLNLTNGVAPAAGLTVNLSSNKPAATVPATAVFTPGSNSVNVTVTGVSKGAATISATAPNIIAATADVNVYVPAITVPSVSVGQNLETAIQVMISPPAPSGGLQLIISSSDTTKLRVTGRPTDTGGTSPIVIGVPQGLDTIGGVYLQGLASSGTATLTVSAPGYPNGTALITLTPSGFVISGPAGVSSFSTNAGAGASVLTVTPMRLDSALNPVENQLVRGGLNPSVALSNSNPTVGAAGTPVLFTGGIDSSVNTTFTPTSTQGPTVVGTVAPSGFSTPASGATVAISVVQATITCAAVTVGQNLEASTNCTLLGGNPPAGLPVTLTSSDSSKLLLSANATDTGTKTIVVNTVGKPLGGVALPAFYVYGVGNSGPVTFTAAATGFAPGTGTVTLAPSGFVIAGPGGPGVASFNTGGANSVAISVIPALLNVSFNYVATQALAGGLTASVNVTSSDPTIGTITTSPVTFSGGSTGATTQFIPLKPGNTDLTVSTPSGFTTPAIKYTKVTAINSSQNNLVLSCAGTIGQNLQAACSVSIGQSAQSNITVTLSSNNAAQLLLSPTATAGGIQTIMVTIPAGGISATYYAQGLASSGTVTYTAAVSGFTGQTGTVTLAPSGVVIVGPFGLSQGFILTGVGNPVNVDVYTAYLTPGSNTFGDIQALRGGLASVDVTFDSSKKTVGTVNSPVTLTGGSGHALTQFTPIAAGSTTVSVLTPAGFTTPSTNTSLAATVQ